MMSNLAGVTANADAAVEGDRSEPDRPAFVPARKHFPEPDVVALVGARSHGSLIGKILLPVLVEQGANRSVVVRATEKHAVNDLKTGSKSDRIGGVPTRTVHGPHDVFSCANETDIQWTSWDALFCACQHGLA